MALRYDYPFFVDFPPIRHLISQANHDCASHILALFWNILRNGFRETHRLTPIRRRRHRAMLVYEYRIRTSTEPGTIMSQQQTPSATGSDQTTGTVQVVLVDNDILALKMLREIMSAWPRVAITWTEHNGSDAFDHYRQCESGIRDLPDLFITDISMRGLSGVDMSRAIRYTNGTMPILGITSYEPTQFYHDAADAGMQAVIGKNELSALKSIIMEVADTGALAVRPPFEVPGRTHLRIRQEGLPYILSLSQQEKQVLTMCSHGYSNADIAQVLDVSPSTINTYITRASRKMGVASKREAVSLWTKTIGL